MYAVLCIILLVCLATHETPVPFENFWWIYAHASHSCICGKKIAAVSLVNILFYLLKCFIMEQPEKKNSNANERGHKMFFGTFQ